MYSMFEPLVRGKGSAIWAEFLSQVGDRLYRVVPATGFGTSAWLARNRGVWDESFRDYL